ncbi:MAG: thiamine pyrophosphate-dependent dehydrogenase E1 component subunit alpha [Dehalococcoidia bacterium]|nr:thiamine pyrophosphate-dependent dehydrogenase E1 component subunit alpha [Dehalococcoidia bacterium]
MVKATEKPARTKRGVASHIGLDNERLVELYRTMLTARLVQERMFVLQRQGRAAFAITGQGHEAAQVGSASALKQGVDWIIPYYRDLGVCLAFGLTLREIMLDFLARAEGPCSGGRQMPTHWSKRDLRIVSGSSPVGTQILHAPGIAWASKVRGLKEVAVVYFGEGATSTGEFHEGVNFAAIHKLPVIFFCENNGYAISESASKQMAVRNVADRARGYGIEGTSMDGNDLIEVYQTTLWAAEECRNGRGPKLLEAKTYRIVPHSSDDDDRRYRTREEVQEWSKKDPIDRAKKYLIEHGAMTEADDEAVRAEAAEAVRDAVDYALGQPYPEPETALLHVYAEDA